MKKTLSFLITLCISFSLSAQSDIIPKPQKEIYKDGFFVIDKNCVIYSNEKNAFNCNYLQDKIQKATGFPFTKVKKHPLNNYVYLKLTHRWKSL
jgi:hypothetical protein